MIPFDAGNASIDDVFALPPMKLLFVNKSAWPLAFEYKVNLADWTMTVIVTVDDSPSGDTPIVVEGE